MIAAIPNAPLKAQWQLCAPTRRYQHARSRFAAATRDFQRSDFVVWPDANLEPLDEI